MLNPSHKKIRAAAASAVMAAAAVVSAFSIPSAETGSNNFAVTAGAASAITINDLPSEYQYAADWIWNNRITNEDSTGSKAMRYNSIFDQIIAGKGTINYVVKWQSYREVTYEQRQQFETMLSNSINDWTKWLSGYENWPYDHIDVNVVGWAVIDKDCLLDLHDDEIVYTDTRYYDAQYDTSNGSETIPDKEPYAPSELSRFDHFSDKSYQYPGGLDKRFDMYMWATQGFPYIGGCGGDWGQRLGDLAYLNMLDGSGLHVLEHEIGHGFGMTDFYGGEGESDGFPPGGFPTENGGSLMMAGSSAEITDFDGWMLRYMWTKIKDENGRFDIEEPSTSPEPTTESTEPIVTTSVVTEPPVETTTAPVSGGTESETPFTQDENGNWSFNVNGADAVEVTFTGAPYGGGSGALGYWDNEWFEITWEGNIDENGKMVVTIELPDNLSYVTLMKYYAGVWDNDLQDMKDIDLTLENVKLIYNETETTTTVTTTETIPVTTTSETTETTVVTTTAEPETTTSEPETTTAEPETTSEDQTAAEEIIYGDADLSGTITINDVVTIMCYSLDYTSNPLSDKAADAADVYQRGDGINGSDAVSVQKLLAKILLTLPESYK